MNKKLYILGLILTDGYKHKNYYYIELKDEDKNVLEDIANNYNKFGSIYINLLLLFIYITYNITSFYFITFSKRYSRI